MIQQDLISLGSKGWLRIQVLSRESAGFTQNSELMTQNSRRIAVTLPATCESPLLLDDAHQHQRKRTVSVPRHQEPTFRTKASCRNKPETDQRVRPRAASASPREAHAGFPYSGRK